MTQNQIKEGWPGPCKGLCDDGILLFNETNDVIQNNTIGGVFDAGIESVYGLTNALIANNVITNVGVAGIGSYHCTNWIGNLVSGNTVTQSPSFGLFYWAPNDMCYGLTPHFQNNVIEGNVLANVVASQQPVLNIDFPSTLPSPVVVGNNLLKSNNFGTVGLAPFLLPASGFINAFPPPTISSVSPGFGSVAGGTTVTIIGTNFQTGAMVALGNLAATSVAVVNATTITAVTGAHAGGT